MQTPSRFSAPAGGAQTDVRHEGDAAACHSQARQKGPVCTSAVGPCGALPRPGDQGPIPPAAVRVTVVSPHSHHP